MDYKNTEGVTEHEGFYLDHKQPKFYWNHNQIKMCSSVDINPEKVDYSFQFHEAIYL